MLACPNKNNKEWKALVNQVGEKEAYRKYLAQGDGTIPSPKSIYFNRLGEEKGEIGVNKQQLLMLLGPTMYNKPLAQVAVKELLQNSFDAVKAASNLAGGATEAVSAISVEAFEKQINQQVDELNEKVNKEKEKIRFDDDGRTLEGDPSKVMDIYNEIRQLKKQLKEGPPKETAKVNEGRTGNINFTINYDNRTIAIQDDGIGMTPEVVKSAFLSIGGTNKEGLKEGERSGGFGLAKVQFLLGSEYVEVATVRNGVKTSIKATNMQLYNDDFIINTEKTDEPNGTFVKVKVPESYTSPEGTTRSIDFPGRYSSNPIESFDILNQPLIGNVNVSASIIKNNQTTTTLLKQGVNIDESVLPPLLSNVTFNWGTADVYISTEKKQYPKHIVLSSGLYQFKKNIRLKDWDDIPYDIVINIKPSVSSTSEQYPFNNQREDYKNTVAEDIKSLNAYLRTYAIGESSKELVDVFKSITPLVKVDPNKNLTPEERAKLYEDIDKTVAETKRLRSEFQSGQTGERQRTRIRIAGTEVKDVKTGKDIEVATEKTYGSTFKAKELKDVVPVDVSIFNENLPQYHNNTNVDYMAIPGAAEFFSDFGSVVYDMVRFAGNELGYDYQKLTGAEGKFFAGVSIDKVYGGIHIRNVLDAIFINPLAFDSKDVETATGVMTHIIIHEINHTTVSGEGADFTTGLALLYGKIYGTGKYPLYEGLMRSVFKKHFDTYKTLKHEYDKSTTRNLSASFEGSSIVEGSQGNISRNVGDVSTRPDASEGDTRDQRDTAGDRGQDRTGEVIQGMLNASQTNDPIIPTVEQQKDDMGQRIVQAMANKLAQNLGVQYEIVTPEQARAITTKAETPWNGEKAFFYDGKVYFLNNGFNAEMVLHEFSHPLIDAVYAQNKKLFDNLYKEFSTTREFNDILTQVKNLYPEYTEESDPRLKKEVLVRALTKEAQNKMAGVQNSTGFKEWINKLIFAIKQALRKAFGVSIKVDKLSTNTTLKEMADMLASDKFEIDTDIISEKDYVEYARDVTNIIESLKDVEDSDLSQTIDRYYDLVKRQINQIQKNKNYSEARKLLINDQTKRGLLQEIKGTLETTPQINEKLKDLLSDADIRNKNASNLVHSIMRLDILTKKVAEHMKELAKKPDSVEVMGNIFYYDLLVRNWDKFIKETNVRLFDAGMDPASELGKILSATQTRIEGIQRQVKDSYTPGVIQTLKTSLKPLSTNIDKTYSDRIQKLRDEKNPKNAKLIEDLEKEWDATKIDDVKIMDLLLGNAGDTSAISAFVEAYTNSPDPIVGGFAIFIKNAYNEVDAESMRNSNEFMKEMDPLLSKAGYSRNNFSALMKKLVHLDDSIQYDGKTGKLITKKNWTMLNPFKGVETKLKQYKHDYEVAVDKGDQAEADRILKEKRQHLKDYFHQEYADEFYKREEIYESLEKNKDLEDAVYSILGIDKTKATDDQKKQAAEFYDKAAKGAYRNKHLLLNHIQELDGLNYDEEYYNEVAEEKTMLWRQYSQLAALRDQNGDPKTGEELLSTLIERKYRKESNKYFEWVPIQGQFEFSLERFEQSLIDAGLAVTDQDYIDKRKKWIKDNTVIKYTKEFYDERNKVLLQLKDILSTLPPQLKDQMDSTAEFEELLDLATGYRDQNGQVIGSDISEKSKQRVKELQEAILEKKDIYAGLSGLTKAEQQELHELYAKIQTGAKLYPEERIRINELNERKNKLGIDKGTQARLQALYSKLSDIQSKESTDYYVDILNNWLTRMGETDTVDNESASKVLQPEEYTRLFKKDADFKKWFEENHILKEVWDYDKQDYVMKYERLFIWNRTRPNNPDHYEKIKLASGEEIQGVPTLSYFFRAVKDTYTDDAGNEKQLRTPKIVGKTVDNRGNFLPKTMAEGAKDNLYENKEYFDLQKNDKAAFDVLEKMKDYHLKFQEEMPRESRLYLQVPRYENMAIENFQSVKGGLSAGQRIKYNIRKTFISNKDDYEKDMNFNPGQLVQADMFDEEIRKIPVTGLYDIKPEEVSMNILDSMMRYMHSGIKQKKLIELNPFAQAIKAIVEDPANAISSTNKFVKSIYRKTGQRVPIKEKGMSIRAKAISNLYDREFKGIRIADKTANIPGLWKFKQIASKMTSLSAFALNIPSAIKNRQAAVIQGLIEASGGRYMNLRSYGMGKIRAWNMMKNNSTEIYRTKNKSLDVQIMEMMDPGQEIFKRNLEHKFGRSVANDAVKLSFLMGPRKFLQFQSTVEIMCGMMYHIKVPQTLNGTTKYIDYINAWEIRNGQIELKDGIDKEWAAGGAKFSEIKNKVHEVGNRLEGTYGEFDGAEIDRYYLGQVVKFMKKYFTSMFMNWFAPRRTSAALGTVSAGNYTNLLYLAKNIYRYGPRYARLMSIEEAAALKKVTVQVASIIIMHMLLGTMFGYDPEEKDRFRNMSKRSGDWLESDPKYPYQLDGWLANQAAVIMLGTASETETWFNPKIFVNTVKGLPVPGALYNLGLQLPTDVVLHTIDGVRGKPSGFYKKDSGPYWFQKKDGPRAIADIARIFGFTGSTVDPVKTMKSIENQRKGLFK